jgi:hypothetical protein
MKTPFDVPGPLAAYRFQNDPRYYDSANEHFIDLSGYGQHCKKTAGTIAFSNHGQYGREGILLDNSCQFRIENPNPWEITVVAVMRSHLVTGNLTLRALLFGDNTTPTSNGMLNVISNLGATVFTTNCGTLSLAAPSLTHSRDTLFINAFAMDQETRKAYSSSDGVTVNESAAAAAGVNGNAASLGWNVNAGIAGAETNRYIRVGNNSGVIGDTAANATDYLHLFALFAFASNQLRNNLPKLKPFMDTEKLYYGIA